MPTWAGPFWATAKSGEPEPRQSAGEQEQEEDFPSRPATGRHSRLAPRKTARQCAQFLPARNTHVHYQMRVDAVNLTYFLSITYVPELPEKCLRIDRKDMRVPKWDRQQLAA